MIPSSPAGSRPARPSRSPTARAAGSLRILLPLLALAANGCAYTLAVESLPTPALVELPDGSRITTPGRARVRWAPFDRQIVTVTATGYRPLEVDLRKRHIRWGRYVKRPFSPVRGEVRFVLVPTHGATGTWSETDVP